MRTGMSGFILGFFMYVMCCVHCKMVNTTLGVLSGGSLFTNSGKEVFSFLGVPYAEPPVGDLRFSEPRPARPWRFTRSAKKTGERCVQAYEHTNGQINVSGNEDCLYLNVYTPKIFPKANLPVLVFFHGGAFMFGTSDIYNPKLLLDNDDIVFVTPNYRLGLLGFLSTEDDVVPGNNGLKDQVLALKWIRDNIAAFGGDPNQVTISGNSAGGASVQFHYLSPLSWGLFKRGISSSGSALMPWALTKKPLTKAKVLSETMGCPSNDNLDMVNCLRQKDPKVMSLKAYELFMYWKSNPITTFGPVVEKVSNNTTGTFLSDLPYKLIKRGEFLDEPWLISLTTDEGLYPSGMFIDREELLKTLNDDWNDIAPHLLAFNYTVPPENQREVSGKIRKFYFGDEKISLSNSNIITKMVGERLFYSGMGIAARLQAAYMNSSVYMMVFGYRGGASMSEIFTKNAKNYGVSHYDDIYYLLTRPMSYRQIEQVRQSDHDMIRVMTNIWISFIKTGRPSTDEQIQWDPVPRMYAMNGHLKYLHLQGPSTRNMTLKIFTDLGNYQFWNSLGLMDNENQLATNPSSQVTWNIIDYMCKHTFSAARLLLKRLL